MCHSTVPSSLACHVLHRCSLHFPGTGCRTIPCSSGCLPILPPQLPHNPSYLPQFPSDIQTNTLSAHSPGTSVRNSRKALSPILSPILQTSPSSALSPLPDRVSSSVPHCSNAKQSATYGSLSPRSPGTIYGISAIRKRLRNILQGPSADCPSEPAWPGLHLSIPAIRPPFACAPAALRTCSSTAPVPHSVPEHCSARNTSPDISALSSDCCPSICGQYASVPHARDCSQAGPYPC